MDSLMLGCCPASACVLRSSADTGSLSLLRAAYNHRSRVDKPKVVGLPVVGCNHVLSASSRNRVFNSPGSGGAASNGPMTISRNCAQRKRVGWFFDFSGEFTANLSLRLRSQ